MWQFQNGMSRSRVNGVRRQNSGPEDTGEGGGAPADALTH